MKTSLNLLSFFFAAALPGAVAAESVGITLPAALDSTTAFLGFVVTLMLVTISSDYARAARVRRVQLVTSPVEKAVHPLAA